MLIYYFLWFNLGHVLVYISNFFLNGLAWTLLQVFDEYNECMELNWICMVLRIFSVCINLAAINRKDNFLWVAICVDQIEFFWDLQLILL